MAKKKKKKNNSDMLMIWILLGLILLIGGVFLLVNGLSPTKENVLLPPVKVSEPKKEEKPITNTTINISKIEKNETNSTTTIKTDTIDESCYYYYTLILSSDGRLKYVARLLSNCGKEHTVIYKDSKATKTVNVPKKYYKTNKSGISIIDIDKYIYDNLENIEVFKGNYSNKNGNIAITKAHEVNIVDFPFELDINKFGFTNNLLGTKSKNKKMSAKFNYDVDVNNIDGIIIEMVNTKDKSIKILSTDGDWNCYNKGGNCDLPEITISNIFESGTYCINSMIFIGNDPDEPTKLYRITNEDYNLSKQCIKVEN